MAYLAYILQKIRRDPLRALGSGGKYVSEYLQDRRIGVSTFRRDFSLTESASGDAKPCQPAPYSVLRAMAEHLRAVDRLPPVFVDVGCGAGRSLAFFSSLGFERMVGIEINGEAAARAQANADRIRPGWRRAGAIEILASDVLETDFDFTGTVLYLANPFGGTTMRRFGDRLREQLLARPDREILVYYVLPLHAPELLESFPHAGGQAFEGADPWRFLRLDARAARG